MSFSFNSPIFLSRSLGSISTMTDGFNISKDNRPGFPFPVPAPDDDSGDDDPSLADDTITETMVPATTNNSTQMIHARALATAECLVKQHTTTSSSVVEAAAAVL